MTDKLPQTGQPPTALKMTILIVHCDTPIECNANMRPKAEWRGSLDRWCTNSLKSLPSVKINTSLFDKKAIKANTAQICVTKVGFGAMALMTEINE